MNAGKDLLKELSELATERGERDKEEVLENINLQSSTFEQES